jgi:hypothetical protein
MNEKFNKEGHFEERNRNFENEKLNKSNIRN